MRITSIGGGPGGLYAAILLKKADPRHDVVVLERNQPTDTFGFGVVFSVATLAELADADAPSHAALMAAAARWDPVDVFVHGQRVRARGNGFAAVSRQALLTLLRDRARELGVDLRFSAEVGDVDRHLDADLVLGADGVNSTVRRRFADVFQPEITVEGGKYIWLGTTKVFDAFTFVFRRNAHGRFQVHGYPYATDRSTFIVETDERTWRAAGLDQVPALGPGESDHEGMAYCAELFAEDLDRHALLPNGSRWLDWATVRNRTWLHGNVVLLGDAAHTAHFSIGSGTRLAMGDAMSLARRVASEPTLDDALAAYEGERMIAVERAQAAAAESLDWFGRADRYWHFDAPQFAYRLLSRSGRVGYEGLRRRDPVLTGALERWFAGPGAPLVPPPPAFTPFTLRGTTLPNRVVLTTTGTACADGNPDQDLLGATTRLAHAGAALVIVEHVAIAPDARITPTDPGLWTPDHAAAWRATLAGARGDVPVSRTADSGAPPATPGGAGAVIGVQLVHAGARGATRPRVEGVDVPLRDGGWPLVAASARAYARGGAVPAALDSDGLARVCEDFVRAARLADEAGFDLLELHLAHGYLLAGFLSPLTNHRDDAYGDRLRFPLEVVEDVRAVWPADKPLAVCYPASDLQPGGVTQDEAVAGARRLAQAGVDLIRVVAGQTTPQARPAYGTAFYAPWADLIRNQARVPTVASGAIPSLVEVDDLLLGGQADLCVLGRPLPPTPAWLERAA